MMISNNNSYEIYLANGDFAIIQEVIGESESRRIVTREKEIDETLYFKDVIILVYDINGNPYYIKCKIIKNILYSDKPNLSSKENKALYIDFIKRNPSLKPNTKEWKDKFISDPYFNALKIKFGYAIICHKAQGNEWKNVLLNCKTYSSRLSQEHFRWIYTALTRPTENLFTLDEPHYTLFSNIKRTSDSIANENNEIVLSDAKNSSNKNYFKFLIKTLKIIPKQILNIKNIKFIPFIKTKQKPLFGLGGDEKLTKKINLKPYEVDFPKDIKDFIFIEVKSLLNKNGINIEDVVHHQYCEQYKLKFSNDICRIKINYNSKNQISKIFAIEENAISKLAQLSLKQLENKIFIINNYYENINNFTFDEEFLEKYYNAI